MANNNSSSRVSRILGQYIIKYQFQFKYSVYVLLAVSITGFLLWFETHGAISRMFETGVVLNDDVSDQLRLISSIVGKTAFLLSGITFGAALILSHYVAGPIYRFEKLFNEIKDGNIGILVRLRPKDEFQDTAEAFNQGLAGLRNKVLKERESVSKVVEEVARILDEVGRSADGLKLKKQILDIHNNPQGVRITISR